MIHLRVKAVELASLSLIWRRGKGKSRNNPGVLFWGFLFVLVFELNVCIGVCLEEASGP